MLDFTPIYKAIFSVLMPILLLGGVGLFLAAFFKIKLKDKAKTRINYDPKETPAKLYKKIPLSEPEQMTFYKLVSALPNLHVFPQVSFSQFLFADGGNRNENFSRFSQARQKVADFLICNQSFHIIAAIEVDDRSHDTEKDQHRDALLHEADIDVIRWKHNSCPSKIEIQKIIAEIEKRLENK